MLPDCLVKLHKLTTPEIVTDFFQSKTIIHHAMSTITLGLQTY